MPLGVDMTESEILDHLEDICATDDFRKSARCSGFLRYVVSETLAGRTDRIKAYAIAVSALGRDETFDPQIDPVVRIEASQLRRRLERYYLTGGTGARIRIDLPKGSYVPSFSRPAQQPAPIAANAGLQPVRRGKAASLAVSGGVLASAGLAVALMVGVASPSSWKRHPVPTVQVNAFVPTDDFSAEMASGLQDEVRRALMANKQLAVVDTQHAVAPAPADFVMEGSVRRVDGWIRVSARLMETRTGAYVWAHAYDRPLAPEAVLGDQAAIARTIVRQVAAARTS
jgi:TolB-like protein